MDNKTCLGLNNKWQTGDDSVTSLFSKTKHFFCFSFNKRSPKDAAWKTEVFCIRYFSKAKRKSSKSITERCFSCQNNSVCRKLAWSCKKWKSAKKLIYALFARSPSIERKAEVLRKLHYYSSSVINIVNHAVPPPPSPLTPSVCRL